MHLGYLHNITRTTGEKDVAEMATGGKEEGE